MTDFNGLVEKVARAARRVDRAVGLVLEAQAAHGDAVAALSAAEDELQRALVDERVGVTRLATPAPIVEIDDHRHLAMRMRDRQRCGMCRKTGHKITTCPEAQPAA